MGFKDMREWIEKLDAEGELRRITAQVDWNRELGAITRKVFNMNGPALLFENIKDYKETRCKKVFTGGLASRSRMSMMLGLPKNASVKDQIETAREMIKHRILPIMVDSGPLKNNVVKGKDINLYDFPVPLWHHLDGGRYINTYCGVVTRDPENRELNVGTYRGMIVDKDKIAVLIWPSRHWGLHFNKYKAMGESMPVAVVYGWDPALQFIASTGIPPDVCEYDVMGSVRKAPVELVKCETCDLEVPAWAEIVVEGSISSDPSTYQMEGPFGEYTGYYGGAMSLRPVLLVNCITHRTDPIFTGSMEGWGPAHPNETSSMFQVSVSAMAWNVLESSGVPGVKDVYCLPASCGATIAVQIQKTYLGQAKQIAMALWGTPMSLTKGKFLIVVDDDIDIHNFEALEWAIAYRVNPGENDLVVVPGLPGSPLDPSVRIENRAGIGFRGVKWDRILIDATKNWEYEPQEQYGGEIYPPVAFLLDPEDEGLVKKRWKEYGLEPI